MVHGIRNFTMSVPALAHALLDPNTDDIIHSYATDALGKIATSSAAAVRNGANPGAVMHELMAVRKAPLAAHETRNSTR